MRSESGQMMYKLCTTASTSVWCCIFLKLVQILSTQTGAHMYTLYPLSSCGQLPLHKKSVWSNSNQTIKCWPTNPFPMVYRLYFISMNCLIRLNYLIWQIKCMKYKDKLAKTLHANGHKKVCSGWRTSLMKAEGSRF